MTTGMALEVLFWSGMALLAIFLGARALRRVQRQHAELDAGLEEAFERHRAEHARGSTDDRAA